MIQWSVVCVPGSPSILIFHLGSFGPSFLVVAIACKLVPLLVYVPILLYLGLAFYLPKHPHEKYNDVFTLLSRLGQQEEKASSGDRC